MEAEEETLSFQFQTRHVQTPRPPTARVRYREAVPCNFTKPMLAKRMLRSIGHIGWLSILAACTSMPSESLSPYNDGSIAHTVDAAPQSPTPRDAAIARPDASPSRIAQLRARIDAANNDAEALDALIVEVAWNEGWPVVEGNRILFLTRWDTAEGPVSVVSDINAWRPNALPAQRATTGFHYWALLEDTDATRGAKYKWHANGTWRPPSEARAYGFDDHGEFGYIRPPQGQRWRERFPDFRSAFLPEARDLRILLPAEHDFGEQARVLIMHDGQRVMRRSPDLDSWRVDETVNTDPYRDVLVLAIDHGSDRMQAYTHVADDVGSGLIGGQADAYGQLLFEEALPFIRRQYSVTAAREQVVVAGASLGGLVSLYFAQEHPEAFLCTIAMSPTLGWGAFSQSGHDALVRRWRAHGTVALYLDSGGGGICQDADDDGVFEDSSDRDNYCTTLQMRDHLSDLGYVFEEDVFHWHEPDAPHHESAWAARLPHALSRCVLAGWRRP